MQTWQVASIWHVRNYMLPAYVICVNINEVKCVNINDIKCVKVDDVQCMNINDVKSNHQTMGSKASTLSSYEYVCSDIADHTVLCALPTLLYCWQRLLWHCNACIMRWNKTML